jgi:DNA-binding GntR family transcriptional regulator
MTLKAIQTSTLQDSVYQQLVEAILAGKIAPGERITIEGIAKQLDVSAMPVREAIRRLEANHFITILKRRITVNELSIENVRDILELRLLIEGYAAEKASLQRSPECLERLEALMEEMKTSHDTENYLKANKIFHNTIYGEARIPIMLEFIDTLWERYSPYLHILLESGVEWNEPRFMENHKGMLDGMRRKEPIEVRKYLERDLTEAAALIQEMIKAQKSPAL